MCLARRMRDLSDRTAIVGKVGWGVGARKWTHIYGVDFSGAQDAGRRIWIAEGTPRGRSLAIHKCLRAMDLVESGRKREICLPALRRFIERRKDCVFGLDFPFGLPSELTQYKSWKRFVLRFPTEYPSADELSRICRERTGGREPKRSTDSDAKTPFSPINLRLYRQTYHGIRDVLYPLVRGNEVNVLPMLQADPGKPLLLEICPASTLKHLFETRRLPSYKGSKKERMANRKDILKRLEGETALSFHNKRLRSRIVDDTGGDALDSVIAALAAFRAVQNGPHGFDDRNIEGKVYV